MDMMLEVVTLPVSDVDRARAFYESLGGGRMPTSWRAMLFGLSK